MATKATSWFKSFLKNTATKISDKMWNVLESAGEHYKYLENKYGNDGAHALVSITLGSTLAAVVIGTSVLINRLKEKSLINKIRSGQLKEKDIVQMLVGEIIVYYNKYNYDPLTQTMVNNTIAHLRECKTFAQLKQNFNSDRIDYIELIFNQNKPDAKSRIDSISFTNNMIMLPRKRRIRKDGTALKRIWGTIKRDPEVLSLKKSWDEIGDIATKICEDIFDEIERFSPERLNNMIPRWLNGIRAITGKLRQIKISDSMVYRRKHLDLFGINSAKNELKNAICKKLYDTIQDFFKPFQVFATFCPRKAAEACNRAIASLQEVKKLVEQYLERYSKKDSKYAIARVKHNRMLMDFGGREIGRAIAGRTSGAASRINGFFNGIKQKISNKVIPQLKKYGENFKKLPGGQKVKTLFFGLIYILARFNQVKSIKEAIDIAKKAKKNIEEIQYNVNEITIENGEVVPNEVPKEAYIARNIAIFMKGLKFLINQAIAVLSKSAIKSRLETKEEEYPDYGYGRGGRESYGR